MVLVCVCVCVLTGALGRCSVGKIGMAVEEASKFCGGGTFCSLKGTVLVEDCIVASGAVLLKKGGVEFVARKASASCLTSGFALSLLC